VPDIPNEQKVIDQIFNEARELPLDQIGAFLEKACSGRPPNVREEVDQLLAHDRQAQAGANSLSPPPPPIGELPRTTPIPEAQEVKPQGVPSQSTATDRNLLFGIAALQFDFITRDQLISAMHTWVLTKHRPLGEILVEQDALAPSDQQLLEAMVDRNLDLHNHDVQRSLARLSSVSSLHVDLLALGDRDVDQTLAVVSAAQDKDSKETETWAHGTSTGRRFQVLRPYREGGMGKVSYARDGELNRDVALKQIRDKFADEPASRTRFVLEAEITGGLEHPGVVPVYGLGQDDDGRPFYAMRFIDGDRLTDAIARFHAPDQKRNTTSDRALEFRNLLRRLIDVCDAMEYAHSRGVLHRDLKPRNIMLGKYGETLVVDWGLAKVVGRAERPGGEEERTFRPSSESESARTLQGSSHGTIGYMSPEQAAGRLDELGPATDVYSLGSILHTILTGRQTFQSSQMDVLERIIQGRFANPRSLDHTIPRPLEAICLKSLATKPAERYQSVAQLATDVERWLADEPVSAFTDPWFVGLQRFARRHRTAVTNAIVLVFAAFITLAMVSGLTISKNRQLRKANSRVTQNYELAEKERRRAEDNIDSTRSLAFQLLSVAEEELSRVSGKELRRQQLTSEALEQFQRLREQRRDDPIMSRQLARMHLMLANVERTLGKTDSAEGHYTEAIQLLQNLRKTSNGSQVTDLLAETLRDLASMVKGLGRLRDSASALSQASRLADELLESHPADVRYHRTKATVLLALASLQFELGDFTESSVASGEAAKTLHKLTKEDDDEHNRLLLVLCLVRHGEALREMGQNDESQDALREAFTQIESPGDATITNDVRHAKARVLLALAKTMLASDDTKQAIAHVVDAVAIWEKLAKEFSKYAFYRRYHAESLSLHAKLQIREGRLAPAEANLDLANELLTDIVDESPDDVATLAVLSQTLAIRAHLARAEGDHQQAAVMLESAIEIQKQLVDKTPESAVQLQRLGSLEKQLEEESK
jgi:serine/threonine-protein kinase